MENGSQPGAVWTYPHVGRWGITALPEGWMLVPGFGARQIGDNTQYLIANIALSFDPLPEDKTLAEYIEKQHAMISAKYPDAKFAGPQSAPFQGAEEAMMLLIRHSGKDKTVEMLHVQHYVRVGTWVGIVTFTAPEQYLRAVRPAHELFLKGLHILLPEQVPVEAGPGMEGQG